MSFGFYDIPYASETILLVWCILSLAIAIRGKTLALVTLLVVTGAIQWPLIAYLGDLRLRLLTDIVAIILVSLCLIQCRDRWLRRRVVLPITAVVLFLLLQTMRATNLEAGIYSLRAIAYPLLLTFMGVMLFQRLDWPRFGRFVSLLTIGVIVYMIAESLVGVPLIDPTPTELALNDFDYNVLRENLPVAYLSDGITSEPWFRPGGPFLNPPIAGIFLGGGVYCAARWLRPAYGTVLAVGGLAAASLAVARGGLLMIALVVFMPLTIRLFGRAFTLVAFLSVGTIAALVFAQQGGTGSHVAGLIVGVRTAITNPLGTGIGTQGYFSNGQGSAQVSETWLGVVFASTGILSLLAASVVLIFILRHIWNRGRGLRAMDVFPLAVLAVASLSESVSALRGTAVMWLLLGESLAWITLTGRHTPRAAVPPDGILWFVRDVYFRGGAERVSLRLAESVREAGVDVTVVTVESPVSDKTSPAGLVQLRAGLPFADLDLVKPLSNWSPSAAIYFLKRKTVRTLLTLRLRELIRRHPRRILVLNHNALLSDALPVEALHRTVVHMHASSRQFASELHRPAGSGIQRLRHHARHAEAQALLRAFRGCRTIVCTSRAEAQETGRIAGRPSHYVFNPLTWDYTPSPQAHVANPDVPLLYVGRLAEEKRPDLALLALACLRQRGHPAALEVIGDGPQLAALRALASSLKIEHSVSFRGAVDVGPDTYRPGSVLLVPSDFESLPLVLLEAISQGVPSVCTASGPGPAWIATESESVNIVPRGDALALADAVESWWAESEQSRNSRVQASDRTLASMSSDSITSAWMNLLFEHQSQPDRMSSPTFGVSDTAVPGRTA